MMLAVIISFAIIAVVQCADDPTKVCMPDKFQSQFYDVKNIDGGDLAVDFKKQLAARRYAISGTRVVLDLGNEATYTIEKNGSCVKKALTPSAKASVFQCLPAGAKYAATSTLGFNFMSMKIQSWEIDQGQGVSVRYAFNTDKPAFPVLRQAIDATGDLGMLIYINPTLTVDPAMFNIPAGC